jgi:putative spermidine/putrescine transport system ATP-binding protein
MIAGLISPDSGTVQFDAGDVTYLRPEARNAVMVFQQQLLFPFLNVERNVAFGLRMRGIPRGEQKKRVARMLELVHLPGFQHRRPHQLSSGQRSRVALARALVVEPRVLLLDEPLANLDAYLRDEMRELLLELKDELGLTIIFVTHDQEEAVLVADRIALMFEGRLVQEGPSRDFYERPSTERIAAFFGNRNALQGELDGSVFRSSVGDFDLSPEVLQEAGVADGPATLLIRPEAVVLGRGSVNDVRATVRKRIYTGTHTRYRVHLAEREWEVLAEAEAANGPQSEDVHIHLPPDRLWIVRRDREKS